MGVGYVVVKKLSYVREGTPFQKKLPDRLFTDALEEGWGAQLGDLESSSDLEY